MLTPYSQRNYDLDRLRSSRARFDELQAAYLAEARGAPYVTPAILAARAALHAAEQELFRVSRLKAYHDQQRSLED